MQTDCQIVYFENKTDFKSLDESGAIRFFNDGTVEKFGIELIGSDGNVATVYFGKDLAKRISRLISKGLTKG